MNDGCSSGCETERGIIAFNHLMFYPLENQEFSKSFEEFADSLSKWPGMYFEMDGSFVWVPPIPERDSVNLGIASGCRQQIDGMVYDRNGRIEYLDLKGTASLQSWLEIASALCEPSLVRIYDVQGGSFRQSLAESLVTQPRQSL